MELSFYQTNKFSLNSSTSKQQYLFSKAKRFKTQNDDQNKIKFYMIQSTISQKINKAPSFPKLKRNLEFPNEKAKRIVPSPLNYNIKSDIEKSVESKKGITIAHSIRKINKSMLSPGPSTYAPDYKPFATQRYSLGKSSKKFQFPIELRKGNSSPGPAYLVNLSKLEKVVGKFVQKKCMKVYSQPTLKKVTPQKIINPQKQTKIYSSRLLHSDQKGLNTLGLQSNKKLNKINFTFNKSAQKQNKNNSLLLNKNNPSILGKFGKAERKTVFEKKIQSPGPRYNWFSQFSKLEKQIYNQKLNKNKVKTNQITNQQSSK